MERIKQPTARGVTTLTYSSCPCDFPTRWYARRGTCATSCDPLRLLAIQEMLNRGTRASRDEGTSSEQIETLARSYVSVDIDGSRYRRRALKRSETSWSYRIVQRCGERCWKRKREKASAGGSKSRQKGAPQLPLQLRREAHAVRRRRDLAKDIRLLTTHVRPEKPARRRVRNASDSIVCV